MSREPSVLNVNWLTHSVVSIEILRLTGNAASISIGIPILSYFSIEIDMGYVACGRSLSGGSSISVA